jgi:hypothetical protein
MEKLLKLIDGKKTFIVSGLAVAIAALQIFGVVIPEYLWQILGAVGLASVRDALNKVGKK